MISMLLAYDAGGNVVGTLDYLVTYDDAGTPTGLADFSAHEEAGGEMTDVWQVSNAVGSKVWPEWIGARAHDFRVELEGPPGHKHIAALVHKVSGHRRERAALEAEIAARMKVKKDEADAMRKAMPQPRDEQGRLLAKPTVEPGPADIRDLVGGPERPLALDDEGRTKPKVAVKRPSLPLIAVTRGPG